VLVAQGRHTQSSNGNILILKISVNLINVCVIPRKTFTLLLISKTL